MLISPDANLNIAFQFYELLAFPIVNPRLNCPFSHRESLFWKCYFPASDLVSQIPIYWQTSEKRSPIVIRKIKHR